jgi:hypothetical protein
MNPDDSDDTIAPADDTAQAEAISSDTPQPTSPATLPVIEPDVDDNADTAPDAIPDPNVATPATSTPDESVPTTIPSDPAVLSASQISPSSLAADAAPQSANTAFLDAIRPLAVAADHRRTAKQEEKLMAFAVQHGSITRADARRLLEISRTTIDRCFDDLVRQGKLIKTGPKSETVYKITGQ